MDKADQERAVAAVMAAMASKKAGAGNAPLAIMGKTEPAIKPNSVVVYSSSGRMLNFSPEELEEPPESLKDNPKSVQKWKNFIPVYTRKAMEITHFQRMSVAQLRVTMERAVVKALQREKEDRKKKSQKRGMAKEVTKSSECILIRNLVGRGMLDDETKEDVITEMAKYGNVVTATAHEVKDPEVREEEAVRVFIRFSTKDEAVKAKKALHLRVFDGRYLAVSYFPLKRLLERDLERDEATEDPLPQKCLTRFTEEDAKQNHTSPQTDRTTKSTTPTKESKPQPPLPQAMLPEHVQALIDVIKLTAQKKEVPAELFEKADPITAAKMAAEKRAMESRQLTAAQEEAQIEAKKRSAAMIAQRMNEEYEAKRRKKEAAKPTENLDGLD
eukprot:TRINITY_DN2480_c3_g1_i2.p1 TRINITY_DN2480_c3_g1~~TRINITY_DN2480_c3_g1_i2.p1  ORF type:complete len:386 (+),score=105.61 TRINITY_DN2480_c3_g1_i2:244-1401(+)